MPLLSSLAVAALAVAPIGQSSLPTPVRAYRDQAVFSTAPPNTKTFTLQLADKSGVHALAAEDRRPLEADVSRGPDGKPIVIVAQTRAIYSIDPAGGSRRRLHTTHDAAHSPVIWGNRLAWIEGRDRVYTAVLGQKAERVPTPRGRIVEINLFGGELALTLNGGTVADNTQVWLQELDGSRRRLLRKVAIGEASRSFVGLSFDGGALYFAQVCSGDPSGCPGHGVAYRYKAGKLTTASVPLDLGGFAQAAGTSYWVTQHFGDCLDDEGATAPCVIERDQLRFR
ncbi:hypothetical protein [Solirubrobacter soli]|uniref:hypothetical protein n=1 Tax=Solirubrobacter soli TaxID=363832 RepID=UPI00041A07B8|nr:hypothetical protein [Solirubrobacter soli]